MDVLRYSKLVPLVPFDTQVNHFRVNWLEHLLDLLNFLPAHNKHGWLGLGDGCCISASFVDAELSSKEVSVSEVTPFHILDNWLKIRRKQLVLDVFFFIVFFGLQLGQLLLLQHLLSLLNLWKQSLAPYKWVQVYEQLESTLVDEKYLVGHVVLLVY